MLKVTGLYNITLSTDSVCLWRLNGCMLDSMYLLVMGVAQIADSNNKHTFVIENINIYVFIYEPQKENVFVKQRSVRASLVSRTSTLGKKL